MMKVHEEDLATFEKARQLISVRRDHLSMNLPSSEGYVVAFSSELLVLHRMSDRIDLDGYEVLRVVDISEVLAEFHQSGFLAVAARLKQLEPQKPRNVDATNTERLLSSIQASYPVVALERELIAPDECDIGRITVMSRGRFRMRLLTPRAEWADDDRWLSLDDVTRVTFDGEYERTLALVAGV